MDPIRFAFGLHLHQPVGNFDQVFEDHVRDVYLPFLDRVAERDFFPLVLHISGPLLEWLEHHDPAYLDKVGRLAADGKLELLLAGLYEPVLASLPRRDRVEQVEWMKEALSRRFGVAATGLWLTERVWEPELAADLAVAGVDYALVDDRHFLATGFRRDQLHTHLQTESDGKTVGLFPIDERLRYLIPFRPPGETASYLRELREAGHRLAVLADDGEKFGGWPGTQDWVYGQGWLTRFLDTMMALIESGEVQMSTLAAARAAVPSGGLAYLPTASYREMEGWSLPAEAGLRFEQLERELGADRLAGPDGAMIRGAHWRNFFVKYSESNRMHKKMQALSRLCGERHNPPEARRAIGRAQCNDAYWHGVFGGLYLPHLRDAIWRELAAAEEFLRQSDTLGWELLDIDGDGFEEIWVHGPAYSAIIAPGRGGVMEEFTVFRDRLNYANMLTRRRESYHFRRPGDGGHQDEGGTPSIHDIEGAGRLDRLPPMDREDRALFVDRVLAADLRQDQYTEGEFTPLWSGAARAMSHQVKAGRGAVTIRLQSGDLAPLRYEKEYQFRRDGSFSLGYRWDTAAFPGAFFAPEISLAQALPLDLSPATEPWRFEITTVSKSERGFDTTRQGDSVTPRWPMREGAATVTCRRKAPRKT